MNPRIARCDVVEVSPEMNARAPRSEPRDLLPWADPYIARLLIKHRVDCALSEGPQPVENPRRAIQPHRDARHRFSPRAH